MIATHPLKTSSVTLPPFQTEPRWEGLIPVFNLVLSGHTSFNFANRTTVISFRPHGYPATILTTISISDTSSNWLRPCCNRRIDYFFTEDIFSFWNWKEIIEIYEISCAVCNYACKLFWICKHFRRRIRLADRNNSLLIDFYWGDPWF